MNRIRQLGASGSYAVARTTRTERREKRVAWPEVFQNYLHSTLADDALAASEIDRFGTDERLLSGSAAQIEGVSSRGRSITRSVRPGNIGGATAIRLAEEGMKVVVADLNEAAATAAPTSHEAQRGPIALAPGGCERSPSDPDSA